MGPGAFLLRDGDPASHESNKGKAAEKDAKIKVIKQAAYAPDTNQLDVHHWAAIEKEILAQEQAWEKAHPGKLYKETFSEFQARVVYWCKQLPGDDIRKTARSMKRRCTEMAVNGNWVSGD